MLFLLNKTLCGVLEKMFSMEFKPSSFSRKNSLPECEEIMSFVHFDGEISQGEICLSMSHPNCDKMLNQFKAYAGDCDFEKLMSNTLGEISNTLAGEFLSLPKINQAFGSMKIHPPIILDDHAKNNPAFPIIEGYCGKITFGEIEILTFISEDFNAIPLPA